MRTGTNSVFVSWRMFGTDPTSIAFNVYRGSTKINATPITGATNVVDNISTNNTYTVRPVVNNVEQAASESASVWSQQYLTVNLQRPAGGTTPAGEAYTYNPVECSVGDLDGDGQYEIIVKWDPSNAKDNSQTGYTGNVYLDAYRLNGPRLWRIDLGRNIRAGAHYTQFMVYDLDSDGKAELACKTAPNTRDGSNSFLRLGPAANDNDNADYRTTTGDRIGYILSGPEYLTIFNGQTGAEMATTDYLPNRNPTNGWGNSGEHHNRVDRFVAAVAYLDGQRPSLVMGRGYYGRMARVAWDWRNGQLTRRWTFDNNTTYAGQGNHQMSVGDTDSDGRDEVFNGSSAINDDGTGMWSNRLGHGDAMHLSDMNPDRAGQELWQCYESPSSNGGTGLALIDARTGGTIWRVPVASGDIGRAMAADIDPRFKGYEVWGATGGLYTITGTQITTTKPSMSFALWWDGDVQREILSGTSLDKWNSSTNSAGRLVTFSDFGTATHVNGTKATPCLSGDLLGDWREEVIFKSSDNTKLLLFTTTLPTSTRIYTLMHDPQYRVAIAWQNAAYNQPPHPSFYIGGGMATPPTPNIVLVGGTPPDPTGSIIQENTTGFCSVEGTIDTNNPGFTGSGFANTNNASGAGINWNVNVSSSGSYTLTWRHANGGTTARTGSLLVNNSTVVSSISFPSTTSWTTWTDVSVTLNLSAGSNVIRLQSTSATGLSNIDYLQVSSSNVQAATCISASSVRVISDAPENNLAVYPNPSENSFRVEEEGEFTYIITDQTGTVKEKGLGNDVSEIGATLKSGVYILTVKTATETKRVRIFKKD